MQTKTLALFGGLAAALAIAGCNSSQPSTPPTSTTTVTTAPPAAVSTTTTAVTPGAPDTKINNNAGPGTSNGTDTATADAVNTAIVHNKEMTGSRVDAVVTGGVARLTGTVQNQQQKALAATTASKTPGVTSVEDKLLIDDTGGVHSAPAAPKVVNHTTIINHYIGVPTGGASSGSGTGMGTGMGTGSGSNGSGSGGAGSGAGSGGSASGGPTDDGSSTGTTGTGSTGSASGAGGGGQ